MKILAHRGYWDADIKSNSSKALLTALELGFGFESDLRDYCGELVVSHDIADASCQAATEVFDWLKKFENRYCFAINIKSDGLKKLLAQGLRCHGVTNYFTFDMSIPQMVEFREQGLTYFTRQSEIELAPVMYEDAAGVWIDGFWSNEWITKDLLLKHMEQGKDVCLVSPDLHNRSYSDFWNQLLSFDIDFSKVYLCTDHPLQAQKFFGTKIEEEAR